MVGGANERSREFREFREFKEFKEFRKSLTSLTSLYSLLASERQPHSNAVVVRQPRTPIVRAPGA